jgi:predicted kinase
MYICLNLFQEIRERESLFERYHLLAEGVDDPGVLKCVFMAGGPGSGKSYVAGEVFAVSPRYKASFSTYGLKLVNSDHAFEAALKQNGIDPKDLATLADHPEEWKRLMSIRDRAKTLTQTQQRHYESGRLGLIIDGTGDDYRKLEAKMRHATALGYDCYMVFVNTSLETAQARNAARPRSLPAQLVQDIWSDVQKNAGAFQRLFGATRFAIVDNDSDLQSLAATDKVIRQWMRAPISNPIGKRWLELAHRHRH